MKTKCLAVALALCMLLSGCSMLGYDARNFMRPPKATGDKASIQKVLETKAGGDITLKYPRKGEFRSAIIMKDLTGDGIKEAVALYSPNSSNAGVTVMFIQDINGTWKDVGNFTNQASEVDRVAFGDVNGDGKQEAVIGWSGVTGDENQLSVYTYAAGTVTELKLEQTYTEMAVLDMDGDKQDEIFTASLNTTAEKPADAVARMLKIQNNQLTVVSSASLDQKVSKYASVIAGKLNERQNGVVLDGYIGASGMTTEVLYYDKKKKSLVSPFYDYAKHAALYFLRTTTTGSKATFSKDINGDSILELPYVTRMPGYENAPADKACFLTNWMRYETEGNNVVNVMSMAINYADGYWFLFPDGWKGHVTTAVDTSNRSMTFSQWIPDVSNNGGAIGSVLLKIQIFARSEWAQSGGAGDYDLIYEDNSYVYAASIPSPENALSMNLNDIKNSFKLIS